VDRPSGDYKQVFFKRYDMRGTAPMMEGQCFLPAISFAAGTVKVTPCEWRNLVMGGVNFEQLRLQVYQQGYFLKDYYFRTRLQFFTETTGMWVVLCEFRGEIHWIGYDAWRGALYEPALDRLLLLEPADMCSEGIEKALSAMKIGKFLLVGQLWKRLPPNPKKRRKKKRTPKIRCLRCGKIPPKKSLCPCKVSKLIGRVLDRHVR